ncbi:MAG: dTDP-4-dehydrorhamnose 3,5-epimerase family protein [Methylobacter sp.]|uniref:dTDP-4-dehydrorhamnose 3,5-epimerase family protein n=1 Tax=Methylobacter sp. TaxID=2051955 RepID=UPI002730EDA8|nr:dTDP-4-dehydrorhamnose 3,5-epimerase family protein [Methylobacter sp.]MDP1664051.1 dTDP-4-dehydrorhamnose 3,5-epimerase family protein [Methylobacter sp.]
MKSIKNVALSACSDSRGTLTEIFRHDWVDMPLPVQWNLVQSEAHVLRGVHVHVKHVDYLVVIKGRMQVGLTDLRGKAKRVGSLIELSEGHRSMLMIPQGIAHGFYFPEPTTFVYGVSEYWDPVHDELGCRWDDPALGIPWPEEAVAPLLSERDDAACSLEELLLKLHSERNKPW